MNKILPLLCLALAAAAASCARTAKPLEAPGTVEGDGRSVASGDLLGEVDPAKLRNSLEGLEISGREVRNQEDQLQTKLKAARANEAYLRKQVERLTRLKAERAVAGDDLERTQLKLVEAETTLSNLRKSEAALRLQRDQLANKRAAVDLALQDLRIVSPVRGPVLETYVTQGEMLLPGTPLADVLDLDSLYVQTFVEERDLTSLRLNDRVRIRVDGPAGKTFEGTISYFGRKAEFSPKYILTEQERSALLYEVRIRLEKDVQAFKVGMPVTVVFGRG
jgi:HlyD family secretion protein